MNTCNDKKKFKTSEASTKAQFRTNGLIDTFLNILKQNQFRQENRRLTDVAKTKYGVDKGMLFSERTVQSGGNSYYQAVPNKAAFKAIDEAKGINYQLEGSPASKANQATLDVIKTIATKMGISIEELDQYVKDAKLTIESDVVGLSHIQRTADGVKATIALAEGMEEQALVEEYVHIARAMVEQANPGVITSMISKIDRFKIYDKVLKQYRENPKYQLANGKPDIRKIKMEAVDKLITELIINDSEGSTEFPELMEEKNRSMIRGWWNTLLDAIRGLYSKSNIDIFKSTAQIIGSGNIDATLQDIKDTALFYQLKDNTAVDNVYNKFKEEGDKLKGPIPATVDAAGKVIEARHYIYDNIVKIFNTVSQLAKGKNKDKFVRTELQKIEDDQKKDWGSEGHTFIDKFISKNLIDKNGYKLATPNEEVIDTRIEPALREKLETFAKQLINSYPPGTRFLTEKMVVNTKVTGMIASTIDFIAIAPNDKTGVKVDVYDWKFTNINRDTNDEIPPFKMKEWNAQMEEYVIMVMNYGVKREQLRYTRMVPFITNYNYAIVGDKKSPLVLTGLEVGNPANPNANTIYTLPVPTASELTGNEQVDRLLSGLRAQWEKLYKLGVEPEEKSKKKSQLQQLSIAIRNLQVKMNFAPLSAIAKTFFNNAADVIRDFENIKYDELTGDEIEAKLGKLIEYRDSTLKFVDLDQIFLSAYPKESLNEDGRKTLRALEENSAIAERLMKKITSLQKEYAMYLAVKKGIVTKENEKSVTFAEKAINGLVKSFYEGTQLPAKLIKLASNLILNSMSLVNINVARKIDEFQPMLVALEKEASAKGKTAFDMIGRITGKGLYLIKKINPEFWKAYSNALENKDKKFLLDNMDVEKYNQLAESALKTEIDNINRTVYDDTNEEANANTREFKVRQAKDSLDINRPTFNGYNDWMFTYLFNKALLEEKHLSPEFKELQKNKAAYDVWNFFTELNERAKKAGYLQKQGSSFFPLVEATILQKMEQSGNIGGEVLKALRDIYTTTADESTSLSKTDPETGELEKQIPRFFTMTSKPVEALSKDLNKVGTLWIKALYEYENNKNLENTLLTLAAVEKEKGSIITDDKGNPVFDGNNPRVNYGKNDNFSIMQTIINDHLYGQTEDTGSLGSAQLASAVSKVNQGKDQDLVEKRVVNVKKGIKSMDVLVRALAVGLKPLISLANAFGFNFQAYINSGRMYKYSEFLANTGKIVTGVGLTNEQKAVLHLINPLNEDVSLEKRREIAKQIGLKNWLSTWSFSDVMMSTNSFPEKRLQYASALSFIENSMVEDGKIVNIRQYLTEQDRQTKYKGTEAERKALEKSFEERVAKLKETRSLDKSVKVEDNNITIPGVSDEELAKFRTKIIEYTRDLNGQMSQDNKANFARDTVFRSFMMFKTWIPKQVILRTKDVTFNIEKGHWEYGRGRAFLKTIAFVGIRNIHTIQDIIAGNEAGLKKLDEMLKAKRDDYFKKTGEQLIITDEEFYDLMRTELTNQMKELKLLFGILALVFAAGAAVPDDDESLDDVTRNRYKYLMKAMNKIQDELSFYYSPTSMESMTKGSIIPSLGLLLKAQNILSSVAKESYGYATDDEEMMKKAYPLKYTFNIMPGFYQVQTEILPFFFPEVAKDMGIRVTAEARQN